MYFRRISLAPCSSFLPRLVVTDFRQRIVSVRDIPNARIEDAPGTGQAMVGIITAGKSK